MAFQSLSLKSSWRVRLQRHIRPLANHGLRHHMCCYGGQQDPVAIVPGRMPAMLRVRRALAQGEVATIATRPDGYCLRAAPDATDAGLAESLIAGARSLVDLRLSHLLSTRAGD